MRLLTRVSQPSAEVVTIEDLEAWIPIPSGSDTAICDALTSQVREELEDHLGRCLVTSSWKLTLDEEDLEDVDEIFLPRPPLISVTSITFYDDTDVASTLSATTDYRVQAGDLSRVKLREDASWPSDPRNLGCLEIAYSAGYGTTAASVPGAIRTAMKEMATFYYRNRGEGVVFNRFVSPAESSVRSTPPQIRRILERLNRWRIVEGSR